MSTRSHGTSRRLGALALLLLLPLTLAPRTSKDLDNGWRAIIVSDTFEGKAKASTLSLIAVPPPEVPVRTDLTISISGGQWRLASASPGCSRTGDAVVCVLTPETLRRQHLLTVTVTGRGPLSYVLSSPVPA